MMYIKNLFPNYIFSDTKYKLVNLWIDLIVKLCENKNNLVIKINNNTFHFKFPIDQKSLVVQLAFDEDELLLKKESFFFCKSTKMRYILTTKKNKDEKETILFYKLILEFYRASHITTAIVKQKYEEISKKYKVLFPYKLEYFNISNYFLSRKEHTLIGIAWSLIFNLDIELIEKIKYFSLNCLTDLINLNYDLLLGLKDENSIDLIIEYTKSLSSFCKESSILWKIMNNTLNYDIEDEQKINLIIDEIKREKTLIQRLKINDEKIFNKKKYIDILNNKSEEIEFKIKGKNQDRNFVNLKQKFQTEIIEYLDKTKFEDEISNKFKDKLISKLNSVVNNETLNENIFEKYKNIVIEFILTENEKNINLKKHCVTEIPPFLKKFR